MAECAECGKETMSFTCSYCGKSFCSDHRLPENHDCQKMEEELERKKEEDDKWFEEKQAKKEKKTKRRTPPKKPSLAEDILNVFRSNITYSIIAVTVIFFLLQNLIPGLTSLMILEPGLEDIMQKPWSIFTVMLLHGGVLHIFANMVTFYFFGKPVENIVGARETLKLYIGAGVVASLAYVGFNNITHLINGAPLGPAVGASGAVVAFLGVVAMLYPEAEVLLYFIVPMKIKTAVYAFAGIEALNLVMKLLGFTLPIIGNFASSAHLAGLLVGLWYGRRIRDKARRTSVFDPLSY
ncbi:MAG: membrane associated rhomboid family serine protease [Candidatus Nanohaloarchaea archaeon]|jgi:membrane associated rhomboid family serine protease